MFARSHSFEPRVGKVQKIFGICYLILALTGVALALYAQSMGSEPYLQYFMTVLFIVMAGKSFYIAHRVSNLIKNGVPVTAEITDITPVRGITIIRASIDVKNYGVISIEHRLAGMKVAEELNTYLAENGSTVPALLVGADTKHPRGMLTLRTVSGHLDRDSVSLLKTATKTQA